MRRAVGRRPADRARIGLVRGILCLSTLVLLLTGCAGAPASTPSTSVSASPLITPAATASPASPSLSTPSIAPTPGVRTITIELADGKVSPNGARVDLAKGEPFVLDITSDRDDEVHVHGFDKAIEVRAGKRVKVELTADRTGRYEVESHHPEMLIVVLQIR